MSVQNKLHKNMKKKFILWNCYLNNLKQFCHIWPRWPWPLTQWPQIGILCCPGRMCRPRLSKVGQGLLELLMGNEKVKQTDLLTCAKQYALNQILGTFTSTEIKLNKSNFVLWWVNPYHCLAQETRQIIINISDDFKTIWKAFEKQTFTNSLTIGPNNPNVWRLQYTLFLT